MADIQQNVLNVDNSSSTSTSKPCKPWLSKEPVPVPPKTQTRANCSHLASYLDPHSKCPDCRKTKCDYGDNRCVECQDLPDWIIPLLKSRANTTKNRRSYAHVLSSSEEHSVTPSTSNSAKKRELSKATSSLARSVDIMDLIKKPLRKQRKARPKVKRACARLYLTPAELEHNKLADANNAGDTNESESTEDSGPLTGITNDSVGEDYNDNVHDLATMKCDDMMAKSRNHLPFTNNGQGVRSTNVPCTGKKPPVDDNTLTGNVQQIEFIPSYNYQTGVHYEQSGQLAKVHTDQLHNVNNTYNGNNDVHSNTGYNVEQVQSCENYGHLNIPYTQTSGDYAQLNTAYNSNCSTTTSDYARWMEIQKWNDNHKGNQLRNPQFSDISDDPSSSTHSVDMNTTRKRKMKHRNVYFNKKYKNDKARQVEKLNKKLEAIQDQLDNVNANCSGNSHTYNDFYEPEEDMEIKESTNQQEHVSFESIKQTIMELTDCVHGSSIERPMLNSIFEDVMNTDYTKQDVNAIMLGASKTTKLMTSYINNMVRDAKVINREGAEWTLDELNQIPLPGAKAISKGYVTRADRKFAAKPKNYELFGEPSYQSHKSAVDEADLSGSNKLWENKLCTLQEGNSLAININSTLELTTLATIKMLMSYVSDERKEEMLLDVSPLLDSLSKSINNLTFELTRNNANIKLMRRDLYLYKYKPSVRSNLRTMPLDSGTLVVGKKAVATKTVEEKPIKYELEYKSQYNSRRPIYSRGFQGNQYKDTRNGYTPKSNNQSYSQYKPAYRRDNNGQKQMFGSRVIRNTKFKPKFTSKRTGRE